MEAFSQLLIGGAVAATVTVTFRAIYNLFLSPMARSNIPGPAYTAASDVWFDYQGLRMDRVRAIHRLFKVSQTSAYHSYYAI